MNASYITEHKQGHDMEKLLCYIKHNFKAILFAETKEKAYNNSPSKVQELRLIGISEPLFRIPSSFTMC